MLSNETLERWLDSINRRTGRPKAAYLRTEEGKVVGQIGNLGTDGDSPGDGWTRYRLEEIVSEGGGVSRPISHEGLKRAEYEAQIRGIMYGLDLAARMFDEALQLSERYEYMDTGEVLRLLDMLRDGR